MNRDSRIGEAQGPIASQIGCSNDNGRLWVVSELYFPEATSTGRFLTGIAEGLASEYEVHVLAAQPTYAARGTTAPTTERHNGVAIRRVWSTRFPKDKMLPRVVNLISFSVSVFIQALFRLRKGDTVVVVSNPPTLPFVVVCAAMFRKARVVILVHDVYPDVLAVCGILEPTSPLFSVLRAAFSWLYGQADTVIAIGRDMRSLLQRSFTVHPDRLYTVPNWGDVEVLRPRPPSTSALRSRIAADKDFVVQYMGNMGRTHGVDVVLDAARALSWNSHLHFVFVGWGAQRESVERAVAEERLAHVSVLDPCSEDELPDYMSAADVAVVAMREGMSGVSVPSRMYNVMAAGRPIVAVAEESSELAMVVRESAIGWIVPPGDSRALADVIMYARDHRDEIESMGARAREVAETSYSRRRVIQLYDRVLQDLGCTNGRARPAG